MVVRSLVGKKVLVMGLGRFGGGVTVSRWLAEQGAIVTVNDAEPAEKLAESMGALAGVGNVTFKLGGHRVEDFLSQDLLVINPAVDKAKSAVVREALAKGIAYTTEMTLFLERNRGMTVGITGSVGKSTTTTLVYEAVRAGLSGSQLSVVSSQLPKTSSTEKGELRTDNPSPRVFLGGNIGKSLLLELPQIRPQDIVVLELSSFMLEDTPAIGWSPDIAVVTNLFPNHLDRHNTMASYAATKQNILKFQKAGDVAILNGDHELVARWLPLGQRSGAAVMKYTVRGPGSLPLLIPGEHNQSNARAALAVLDALGARGVRLDREAAERAITGFAGLAHRLQLVHSLRLSDDKTIRFYNDSKATSPDASITALHAFPKGSAIFLVGGYDKHIDLSPFEALLAMQAGGVIGVGQTGEAILEHVAALPSDLPRSKIAYAGTLEAAIPLATTWARETAGLSAIVLSPASASWDQFSNYEKRGETFIALAQGAKSSA